MATLNLIAPWFKNRQQGVLRVKTVQVSALFAWNVYYKYQFLFGLGVKLNRIARHTCGSNESAIERLARAQRVISFIDATGCKPISAKTCPKSHKDIQLLDYPDHLTYWQGPKGEPLVLVEPYTSLVDIQNEIAKRGLTAVVLQHPGIYGGGNGKTTTVLLANPCHEGLLEFFSSLEWQKPLGKVKDINWFEALNLGKVCKS